MKQSFTRRTLSLAASVVLMSSAAASIGGCDRKKTPVAPGPTITGLQISGAGTLRIGQTANYTATATYSDGTTLAQGAAWTSSSTTVAEISPAGQVMAWTAGSTTLSAAFEGQSTTQVLQVNNPLIGQWVLVASPNPGVPSGIGTRIKTFTGSEWLIQQTNGAAIVFRHGGHYTLRGTAYSELVEFANANTANLIGQTFTATVVVNANADRFTQGSEEWSRVQ